MVGLLSGPFWTRDENLDRHKDRFYGVEEESRESEEDEITIKITGILKESSPFLLPELTRG